MGGPELAAADIFLSWLNRELGREYRLVESTGALQAVDAERTLEVTVSQLYSGTDDGGWARRVDAISRQLAAMSNCPFSLWIPPEADLPHGDRSDFLRSVVSAAESLQPGSRGQVDFPVTLTLKKMSGEASYVQVLGGLAPHWAKLTGKAYGQYFLDATAIHRLPEPASRVSDLLEWVALLGNGMKAGASSEIKAEDVWTVTRPAQTKGVTLLGAPPNADPANGTSVRRLLRQALRSVPEPQAANEIARALVLVGIFRSIEEENATIALKGCDPALYEGLDLVALVADGTCRVLFGPQSARL